MAIQGPKGAPDWLPPTSELIERVIETNQGLFRTYGYRPIDTPPFESTDVFLRGLDESSDMVNKEMYTFQDRQGRSLTLRPEGTAPVMRAVLEHNLVAKGSPVKLYYTAPSFRYERPQKGRYRVHTQTGVEAIGSEGPLIDAEVIDLAAAVYRENGLEASLFINSTGHPECRGQYRPKLVSYLEDRRDQMCADCQRKIDTNPLRTFDCKVPADREIMANAPVMIDHLCDECSEHFAGLRDLLSKVGIDHEIDPTLVRGFDYYTKTTFTFRAEGLGAQDEVGGGGRYDGLSEQLGGGRLPGIGFGLGVERIALALEQQGADAARSPEVFVVSVGDDAVGRAFEVATQLRRAGIAADLDHDARSLKGQFRAADRSGAPRAVVIGEREIEEGNLTVRDMIEGQETKMTLEELVKDVQA